MNIELDENAQRWSEVARDFADEYLQPHEVDAEMNGGELSPELKKRNTQRALDLGLTRLDVPKSHGGLGLSMTEQVAIWEQLGRVTNALSWCFSEPQHWMFEACSEQQIDEFILPLMRGEKKDCYAISESGPGSDVSSLEATATKTADGYRLNGEKWYVTSANLADFFWFQARVPDENAAALFLVDIDADGVDMTESPLFSHTYGAHHPTYVFRDVTVPGSRRVGKAGDDMAYTRSWFRHERLMIGARSCGAAARLIDEATGFAQERMVDGQPLSENRRSSSCSRIAPRSCGPDG